MLPAGASVINLGRGEHVVEAELMAALDSGHSANAVVARVTVELSLATAKHLPMGGRH